MNVKLISYRNKNIDLIKGICIILMVLGHTPFIYLPGCGFMYLFHMAVFFIASGFLFNDKYSDNIRSIGKFYYKKIKGLWLPFFLFTEAYVLLNNLFLDLHIYITNVPDRFDQSLFYAQSHYFILKDIVLSLPYTFLMDNSTHMGGALWFVQVLFFVLILYASFDFLIKKIIKNKTVRLIIQGIISFLLLSFGYFCSINGLFRYSFGRIASVYILIYIGVLIKEFNIIEKLDMVTYKWIVNIVLIFFNLFIIFFCYLNIGSVGLDKNSYVNPLFFVFVSIVGWNLVLAVSNVLIYLNLKINKLIEYVSKRSFSIVALHFLCFKIVTYIGIVICRMDIRYLAASADLFKDSFCWIAYTIVGITVPLLLDYFYLKIKGLIISKASSIK